MNRMKEKQFINKPQCIWDELFLVWKDENSWLAVHANRYQVSQIECAICHFDRIWYVNHQLHSSKAFLLTIGESIIFQQVSRHPQANDAVSRKKICLILSWYCYIWECSSIIDHQFQPEKLNILTNERRIHLIKFCSQIPLIWDLDESLCDDFRLNSMVQKNHNFSTYKPLLEWNMRATLLTQWR